MIVYHTSCVVVNLRVQLFKLDKSRPQPIRSQNRLSDSSCSVTLSPRQLDVSVAVMSLLCAILLLHLPFNQALPASVDKCSSSRLVKSKSCQSLGDRGEECGEGFEVHKFSLSASETREYGMKLVGGGAGKIGGGGEKARTGELLGIGLRPVKEGGGRGGKGGGR